MYLNKQSILMDSSKQIVHLIIYIHIKISYTNNFMKFSDCFTYDESDSCREQSLYFYDKQCINATSYCAIANLDALNDTHCYNSTNDYITHALSSVERIVSTEDFYR